MQVNKILNSIEQQIEVLKSEKGKPVDPAQTQKIEQILENQFSELEKTINTDAPIDKKVIAKTLNTLDRELQHNSLISAEKIKSLRTEISTIKNTLDHNYQPADVRLAMILDIDSEDHNGAVFRGLINCLESRVPFITTPKLLAATMIDSPNKRSSLFEQVRSTLLENQNEWDILQQEDSKTGKQLLVFIPKQMKSELSLEEKIRFMDLNPDVLHKTSIDDALAGPKDVMQFQSLPNLFVANPKHSKLIFLNGHGSPHASGGLNREHFGQFIDLIKAQKCQGLTILSCYSGGATTLDFTPKKKETASEATTSEPVYAQTVSFPVIVRSPGDYTSLAGSEAESDLNPHFDVMDRALKESGGASRKKFTEAMIKAERGMDKHTRNLVQVYFPTSGDSPGGFTPLNEIEGSYSLTYTQLRARKIDAKGGPIEIKNATSILLYPQVYDVSLQIVGPPPPLLSATPGTSHHYIKNLMIKESTLSEFLESQRSFYGTSSIEFPKAFFIDRLECADGVYEGVVLDCDATGKVTCIYQKEGKFEKNEENLTTTLTENGYSLLTCDLLEVTTPKKEAVRYTTGGQEDKLSVERHVLNEQFIKIPHFFNSKEIPKKSEDELLSVFKSLSESEKAILVFDLIKYKRNAIVEKLVRDGLLDPNIKSTEGDPLLHIAISEKDDLLFKTLLEKGADPNIQDDIIGHPPLVIALKNRNKACFDALLADPRININLLNKEGLPPLIFFAFIPEAMDSMLKAGANIHIPCGPDFKQTIFSMACRYPLTNELRKKILDQGVMTNRGTPSPIESAAIHGDIELVDMLIKAGANPWMQQYDGNVPIHKILLKAPRSIIMKLLDLPGANFNVTDSSHENPLDIALERHDMVLVQELLKRGARLSVSGYNNSYSRQTINHLLSINNLPFLKQLIDSHKDLITNLEATLFESLELRQMDLESYLKEGIFTDLNTPHPELRNRSYFWVICAGSIEGRTHFPLIETCLSLNANVNQSGEYFFEQIPLIELVLKNHNKQLAEMLLAHGLDKETYQQTIIKLSEDNFMRPWLEENGLL